MAQKPVTEQPDPKAEKPALSPEKSVAKPSAKPAVKPVKKSVAKPDTEAVAKPVAKKPAARPASEPAAAPPPPERPAALRRRPGRGRRSPRSSPASRRRARQALVVLSFLACVLAPGAVAGYYLYGMAADQYASKVGFTVRREDASSPLEMLGGLTSLSNSSSSDTDILYEFIQSQKLVAEINDELDLRAIWSLHGEEDFVFSIDPSAPIEQLVHYWNRMVRIAYSTGTGLIEVEVLAFAAEDATAISRKLFEKSSTMINELSDIARQDSIRYARAELDEALDRLKEARAVVTRFRNVNQIVNPEIDIQTQAGLIGSMRTQQAQTLIEIDLLRGGNIRDSDPRLVQANRRLEVIQNRIAIERTKMGIGGQGANGTAFADLLGDYERLVVDREFAEKSYVTALAAYDAAQAEARRKTRYLAAYMQPTEAETPEYPERLTLLSLVALFLFLIWSVVMLVIVSLRDRR